MEIVIAIDLQDFISKKGLVWQKIIHCPQNLKEELCSSSPDTAIITHFWSDLTEHEREHSRKNRVLSGVV